MIQRMEPKAQRAEPRAGETHPSPSKQKDWVLIRGTSQHLPRWISELLWMSYSFVTQFFPILNMNVTAAIFACPPPPIVCVWRARICLFSFQVNRLREGAVLKESQLTSITCTWTRFRQDSGFGLKDCNETFAGVLGEGIWHVWGS